MQLCLTITNFNSNTSHVTINLTYRCRTAPRVRDSNTSHVTINLLCRSRRMKTDIYSNTSHVTINRGNTGKLIHSMEFKYISCYY